MRPVEAPSPDRAAMLLLLLLFSEGLVQRGASAEGRTGPGKAPEAGCSRGASGRPCGREHSSHWTPSESACQIASRQSLLLWLSSCVWFWGEGAGPGSGVGYGNVCNFCNCLHRSTPTWALPHHACILCLHGLASQHPRSQDPLTQPQKSPSPSACSRPPPSPTAAGRPCTAQAGWVSCRRTAGTVSWAPSSSCGPGPRGTSAPRS